MIYKLPALIFILSTLFGNCEFGNKETYAIRDFRKSLQPYLIKVLAKGSVYSDSTMRYIQIHAADEELVQLSRSEHPVLRAVAFKLMLESPSFDHFELIMNNLDDSAIVAIDDSIGREGGDPYNELEITFSRVSEYILTHGKWKDSNARKKTIEEVILRHNYLRSAYEKLLEIEPKEIYYSSINDMLQRESTEDLIFHLMNFKEFESALYGLAKFRKKEDIPFIKDQLMHDWRLTEVSFRLMQDYPNATYMEAYERFYRRSFYNIHRINRDYQQGYFSTTISFIWSIASYRNERSARILDSILNKKPFTPCMINLNAIEYVKEELALAIWSNPCAAYSKMRAQIEKGVKEYEKNRVQSESVRLLAPNTPEPISWR